jgi:hypothetical protein
VSFVISFARRRTVPLTLALIFSVTAGAFAAHSNAPRAAAEYAGAVTDWDLFVLATAAELRAQDSSAHQDTSFDDVLKSGAQLLRRNSQFTNDGRWLFQFGAWATHPDFRFAGSNDAFVPSGGRAPLAGVGEDVAHFGRWPAFLQSFRRGWKHDSATLGLLDSISSGLVRQVENRILVSPDSQTPWPRMNSFMGGSNGWYRVDYSSARGDGYGPYELSGSLTYSWWSLLESAPLRAAYRELDQHWDSMPPWALFGPAAPSRNKAAPLDHAIARTAAYALWPSGKADCAATHSLWQPVWAKVIPVLVAGTPWTGSGETTHELLMATMWAAACDRSLIQEQLVPMLTRWVVAPRFDAEDLPHLPLGHLKFLYFTARLSVILHEVAPTDSLSQQLSARTRAELIQVIEGGFQSVSQTGWGEPKFSRYDEYLRWKAAYTPTRSK